jgi:(2R)-ethylmalonyl-CoA mutase
LNPSATPSPVRHQTWPPLRLLLGKPGLDGHSNGAEQIAARARDCGMDITYDGIRLTPAEIVAAAPRTGPCHRPVDPVGQPPAADPRNAGPDARKLACPARALVVGGIIPDEDARPLRAMGVARVYTPKDFQLNRIMLDLVPALADPAPLSRTSRIGEFQPTPVAAKGVKPFQTNGKVSSCIAPCF